MLNIEKYKDEILKSSRADLSCCVHSDILHLDCVGICSECKKIVVEWLTEEYKEPLLDDAEREYLSAVIKPFKKRVISITKVKDAYETKRFLRIVIKGNDGREEICLPWFKGNTKYKGMKDFKGYTVEELGL